MRLSQLTSLSHVTITTMFQPSVGLTVWSTQLCATVRLCDAAAGKACFTTTVWHMDVAAMRVYQQCVLRARNHQYRHWFLLQPNRHHRRIIPTFLGMAFRLHK